MSKTHNVSESMDRITRTIAVTRKAARFVRSIVPNSMCRAFSRVGQFFENGVEGTHKFPSVEGALLTLKALGFNPVMCVDVGAYRGDWTRMFRKLFPTCGVLMIEAQESKQLFLNEVVAEFGGEVAVEHALLGALEGTQVIFNEMETGSSVFAEASEYERVSISKMSQTLDGVLNRRSYSQCDILKLDVQGYELEVLKGSGNTIRAAQVILLEASLVPINDGCPLLSDVVAFLADKGFRLFDFCSQIRRKDGVLWQTDLLFLREDSALQPEPRLTAENWIS